MKTKTFVLAFIIGLFAVAVWADAGFIGEPSTSGVPVSGGGACDTTCNSGTQDFSSGDNESFETGSDGTFCTADWVANDADGVINTSDNAQAHCGSYSLSIVAASGNTGVNNAQVDLGIEDADIYLRLYFRCPDVAAWRALRFLIFFNTGATNVVGGVRLRDWNAGEELYLERGSALDDEYFALTAGSWYRLDIHVVGSGGNMTMKVYNANDEAVETSTGGGDVEASLASNNYDTRIIRFWDDYDNAAAITYYVDDIIVDMAGTGYIGGCSCP